MVSPHGRHTKQGACVRVDLHPTEAPTLDRRKRVELVDDRGRPRDDPARQPVGAPQVAQRHAGAQQITIRVLPSGRYLRIEVGDDGSGGADERTGSGLQGLRDRVEAVGGVLRVASASGHGTLVRADIPLAHN